MDAPPPPSPPPGQPSQPPSPNRHSVQASHGTAKKRGREQDADDEVTDGAMHEAEDQVGTLASELAATMVDRDLDAQISDTEADVAAAAQLADESERAQRRQASPPSSATSVFGADTIVIVATEVAEEQTREQAGDTALSDVGTQTNPPPPQQSGTASASASSTSSCTWSPINAPTCPRAMRSNVRWGFNGDTATPYVPTDTYEATSLQEVSMATADVTRSVLADGERARGRELRQEAGATAFDEEGEIIEPPGREWTIYENIEIGRPDGMGRGWTSSDSEAARAEQPVEPVSLRRSGRFEMRNFYLHIDGVQVGDLPGWEYGDGYADSEISQHIMRERRRREDRQTSHRTMRQRRRRDEQETSERNIRRRRGVSPEIGTFTVSSEWLECSHPGCTMRCRGRDRLRIHEWSHEPQHRYRCDECTSTFRHPYQLRRHGELHASQRAAQEALSSVNAVLEDAGAPRIATGEDPEEVALRLMLLESEGIIPPSTSAAATAIMEFNREQAARAEGLDAERPMDDDAEHGQPPEAVRSDTSEGDTTESASPNRQTPESDDDAEGSGLRGGASGASHISFKDDDPKVPENEGMNASTNVQDSEPVIIAAIMEELEKLRYSDPARAALTSRMVASRKGTFRAATFQDLLALLRADSENAIDDTSAAEQSAEFSNERSESGDVAWDSIDGPNDCQHRPLSSDATLVDKSDKGCDEIDRSLLMLKTLETLASLIQPLDEMETNRGRAQEAMMSLRGPLQVQFARLLESTDRAASSLKMTEEATQPIQAVTSAELILKAKKMAKKAKAARQLRPNTGIPQWRMRGHAGAYVLLSDRSTHGASNSGLRGGANTYTSSSDESMAVMLRPSEHDVDDSLAWLDVYEPMAVDGKPFGTCATQKPSEIKRSGSVNGTLINDGGQLRPVAMLPEGGDRSDAPFGPLRAFSGLSLLCAPLSQKLPNGPYEKDENGLVHGQNPNCRYFDFKTTFCVSHGVSHGALLPASATTGSSEQTYLTFSQRRGRAPTPLEKLRILQRAGQKALDRSNSSIGLNGACWYFGHDKSFCTTHQMRHRMPPAPMPTLLNMDQINRAYGTAVKLRGGECADSDMQDLQQQDGLPPMNGNSGRPGGNHTCHFNSFDSNFCTVHLVYHSGNTQSAFLPSPLRLDQQTSGMIQSTINSAYGGRSTAFGGQQSSQQEFLQQTGPQSGTRSVGMMGDGMCQFNSYDSTFCTPHETQHSRNPLPSFVNEVCRRPNPVRSPTTRIGIRDLLNPEVSNSRMPQQQSGSQTLNEQAINESGEAMVDSSMCYYFSANDHFCANHQLIHGRDCSSFVPSSTYALSQTPVERLAREQALDLVNSGVPDAWMLQQHARSYAFRQGGNTLPHISQVSGWQSQGESGHMAGGRDVYLGFDVQQSSQGPDTVAWAHTMGQNFEHNRRVEKSPSYIDRTGDDAGMTSGSTPESLASQPGGFAGPSNSRKRGRTSDPDDEADIVDNAYSSTAAQDGRPRSKRGRTEETVNEFTAVSFSEKWSPLRGGLLDDDAHDAHTHGTCSPADVASSWEDTLERTASPYTPFVPSLLRLPIARQFTSFVGQENVGRSRIPVPIVPLRRTPPNTSLPILTPTGLDGTMEAPQNPLGVTQTVVEDEIAQLGSNGFNIGFEIPPLNPFLNIQPTMPPSLPESMRRRIEEMLRTQEGRGTLRGILRSQLRRVGWPPSVLGRRQRSNSSPVHPLGRPAPAVRPPISSFRSSHVLDHAMASSEGAIQGPQRFLINPLRQPLQPISYTPQGQHHLSTGNNTVTFNIPSHHPNPLRPPLQPRAATFVPYRPSTPPPRARVAWAHSAERESLSDFEDSETLASRVTGFRQHTEAVRANRGHAPSQLPLFTDLSHYGLQVQADSHIGLIEDDVWEQHQRLARAAASTPPYLGSFADALPSARIGGLTGDRATYIDEIIRSTASSGHGAGERGGVPEGVWYNLTFERRLDKKMEPGKKRRFFNNPNGTLSGLELDEDDDLTADSEEDEEFVSFSWDVQIPACGMKDLLRSTGMEWGTKAMRARDWALEEMVREPKGDGCTEAIAEWWEAVRGGASRDVRCKEVGVRVLEP